jgi:hypothetical protein
MSITFNQLWNETWDPTKFEILRKKIMEKKSKKQFVNSGTYKSIVQTAQYVKKHHNWLKLTDKAEKDNLGKSILAGLERMYQFVHRDFSDTIKKQIKSDDKEAIEKQRIANVEEQLKNKDELIGKLKQLASMTNKMKIEDAASVLKIARDTLFSLLLENADELSEFKIDGDFLIKQEKW